MRDHLDLAEPSIVWAGSVSQRRFKDMSNRVCHILCIYKVSRRSKSSKRARTQGNMHPPLDDSDDSSCTYCSLWIREVSNLMFTLEGVGCSGAFNSSTMRR